MAADNEPFRHDRSLTVNVTSQVSHLVGDIAHARAVQRPVPLVTLYLTERCNSRCVTCDYWRHGRVDMTLESVRRQLPALAALGTQTILVSGGEPLLNREWLAIAQLLRAQGLNLWLLTSGLSLAKHASRVSELFESVTVSLDGTNAQTYAAIRGIDAFDKVCEGMRAAAALGMTVQVRVTVQRANYLEMPDFAALCRDNGARQISFLAADVSNPHAFGRNLPDGFADDIALRAEDLPRLAAVLDAMEREQAEDFRAGFIAESPQKLRRRLLEYYTAVCGHGAFPEVHCNAPEFSAVVETTGKVRPCFFIPGPEETAASADLEQTWRGAAMAQLRADIRSGQRAECRTCVCSMWRSLQ